MNFLIDAQLPRSLCAVIANHGHDAVHTSDLPSGNASKDSEINRIAAKETRVVVSKDTDFFYSHVAQGIPERLLLVRTGNISAKDLCELFDRNMPLISEALRSHSLVEIDRVHVNPIT